MTTSADRTAKSLRVWEKAAPGYDRQIVWFEKIWFGGGREWLGARAQGRILELAVGTGRSLPFYPAGATVTGLDLSPAMLATAGQRAAGLGIDLDLHTGDAQALAFGNESFDTVLCALSLCTIPDPAAALGEMHRVLSGSRPARWNASSPANQPPADASLGRGGAAISIAGTETETVELRAGAKSRTQPRYLCRGGW